MSKAHDRDAVAESMDHDDRGDDEAEAATDDETGRQGDAIQEAVDAHPACADHADMAMGGVAMIEFGRRFVTDVDGRQLLDDVEGQETERGRQHHLVESARQEMRSFRDQVEEGRPDPDPGTDRDESSRRDRRHAARRPRRGRPRGRQLPRRRMPSPASGVSTLVQTRRTQAEEFETVVIDAITRPTGDLAHDVAQAGVVDLVRATAPRTDDVVVMRRLAADVGVLAARQVEPLDDAQLREDFEGPKDGRPTDARAASPGSGDQLGRGEVAVTVRDQAS